MRESDWSLIEPGDVVDTQDYGVSIFLGMPERGERTKTGVRQGVRVDRDGVAAKLLWYKERAVKQRRKKVFGVTPRQLWMAWRRACKRPGYEPGPPHSLRHTCASFDMLEKGGDRKPYRTQQQIACRPLVARE